MQQTSYARITVRDIIDRADVGRSTFYAHYRDKDDLLLVSCTEHVRERISAALGPNSGDATAAVRVLFDLVAEHPDIYRPLMGQRANATVLRSIRQVYAEVLAEHLGARLDSDPDAAAATITFLSWGLYGLLESVVDPHQQLTSEAGFRHFLKLWTGADDALEPGAIGPGDR